ncbi:MAG: aminoacyl-histidine dipeptidase [Ferruginibacter sp.]
MSNLQTLEPAALWKNFADLNAVPRASKKEEKVIQFMINFGKRNNLETLQDQVGNVIIKKPATAGMGNKQPVVLQSHLDMVHQKNGETIFDFDTQGIDMIIDNDWVKAKGTTLGADNGIGVASIMSILESKDISHPPIEALFTIDEETGMTGALGLKPGLLSSRILLNLDTENDTELTIGCAGAVNVTASGKYEAVPVQNDSFAFRIIIKGLAGGHSGMDIHIGRGNSNKMMNRMLSFAAEKFNISINYIDGGGLRNAIPRESISIVTIPEKEADTFQSFIKEQDHILKAEYKTTDPNCAIILEKAEMPSSVLSKEFQKRLLRAVYACPNGIYRMSPDIPGLVQSSNNLARVLVKDGAYSILCLTRSAVDSEKTDLAKAIISVFELMNATIILDGSYPGWEPDPKSSIVSLMSGLYKELFNGSPEVNACHAGLECGIIGEKYPGMEMISFGPNILGAHSPDERVQVSSVQKYWKFLIETLSKIPVNK